MTSELYKKVMVATDGSEQNKKAISYGIEFAKLSGAKLYVVYVVDTAAFASIPMDAGWEMMYELLETEGKDASDRVVELGEAQGLEIESAVLEGHPSNEIIEFAEGNDIDMIVIGTLGKSGLDRFLLGSVAEKVTRNSKVPVLVVRGEVNK
ncbi:MULTISPECIES: universal stress protein [Methanococcoides]|jgi:nucleotide-binding universal stress UspA family protein|uniref:Universal stress protein n=1 Tax=Methanococcoides seepicolus TaxID=2828780 RepID=A0A9E5DCA4_9EURY|nr:MULTISPECIES: universal stress protein [Methanococcoides]MCM1987612.1 universal stress protein [Methanococcoides seepicolus]NOQ47822.1 universal stress protein [Methanococcoides sp.]